MPFYTLPPVVVALVLTAEQALPKSAEIANLPAERHVGDAGLSRGAFVARTGSK